MKVFLDTNSLWGQALLGGEEEKPPKRAWPLESRNTFPPFLFGTLIYKS